MESPTRSVAAAEVSVQQQERVIAARIGTNVFAAWQDERLDLGNRSFSFCLIA